MSTTTTLGPCIDWRIMAEYGSVRRYALIPDGVARELRQMIRGSWTEFHGVGYGESRWFEAGEHPEGYALLREATRLAGRSDERLSASSPVDVCVIGRRAHDAGRRSFAYPPPDDWRELRDEWSAGLVCQWYGLHINEQGWRVSG